MISKGDNSIIARVTDSDNMINSDSVTVEFDGVRVDTEVNVNGLPYNVNSADIRFIVRDYGEELDLEGSEVRMYRENAEDTTVEINRVNYAEESRIRITPSAAITEAGTYKIEVIPKMKSGRYGTGELYRFSYCPGGSHVFYYTEPASKTRDNAFRATGYMEPKPDIARFVFVQPAGGRITYDVSFGADGSFTLDYPELIQQEGINSYYIATVVNGIRCDDIRRAVMYDIEFAGIEEPYVKGEKP